MGSLDSLTSRREVACPVPEQSAVASVGLFRNWFAAILILAVFAVCVPTIPSADMWWHLSTGRYVLETHSMPHADPFSATISGKPWTVHEWLSGVVFYFEYSRLGPAGLLLLTGFVLALAFWLAFQRSGGPLLARILALTLGLSTASPIFSVRPQIFTYLLASVFLFVLCRSLESESCKLLILLPLLTILWVNLHGGYALGLALILLFAAGAVADCLVGQAEAVTTKRRVGFLLLSFVACLIVVPLNPYGFAMYTYPLVTLRAWGDQTNIIEWQSPDFHLAMFHPFAALLFLTVAALTLSKKRPKPSQVLPFLFLSFAALYSVRNLPFFVLVAFPLLAEHAFLPSWKLPALSSGVQKACQVVAVLLVAVACTKIVSNGIATELFWERTRFPDRATSFLDTHKLPAPLFNSYDFGGYLIWRLYPRYRVYIDGRTDLYGHTFFDNFLQVYQVEVDPRPALDRDGIRTVLVEPSSRLAGFLRTQSDWKRLYEDPVAVIFSR